jgi:trimeric autotransporter adhesin
LRKTIITALLSILGTIAGFYFGARTAQISSEQATRPPSPTGGPATGQQSGPTVTNVSPNNGPVVGGQDVTVTGSGFNGATAVNFGTAATSNLTVADDTKLTVISPPGVVGTVDVTVTTPVGMSAATPADRYTYS